MNKAQQDSFRRIRCAAQSIEQLAPREMKQASRRRKHDLENAHATLTLHAHKLQLAVPQLSTFYQPEHYLEHARLLLGQLQLIEAIVALDVLPGEPGTEGWQVFPASSQEIAYPAFEHLYGWTREQIDGLKVMLRVFSPTSSIMNCTLEWCVLKWRASDAQQRRCAAPSVTTTGD